MISKERLTELIEQGATIYGKIYGDILAIELSKKNKPEIKYDDRLDVYCTSNEWRNKMQFCYLFETKEDARWELEMTATRTETLKLANYTDFENENGDRVFYHKGIIYELSLWWASDNTKIIRVTWNGRDGFGWLFEKPLTKENYIEACKLCLRLFKGEKV